MIVARMDPIPDGSTGRGRQRAGGERGPRGTQPGRPIFENGAADRRGAAPTPLLAAPSMPLPPRTLGFISSAQAPRLPPLRNGAGQYRQLGGAGRRLRR